MFPADHGEGEFAKGLGIDTHRVRGDTPQQAGAVQPMIEKRWQMPEEGNFLLQVDIDAAEENLVHTEIRFVRADRGVERDQGNFEVQTERPEPGCRGIVPQTGTAEHPRRSGREINDAFAPQGFEFRWGSRHGPGHSGRRTLPTASMGLYMPECGSVNLRNR